jgi:branched-chain amino acid transport system permease protein
MTIESARPSAAGQSVEVIRDKTRAANRARWLRRTILLAALCVLGVGAGRSILLGPYAASQWLSLLTFGLALGGVYALMALGYTMVYGVLRLINFAHGDVMMLGTFGAYFLAAALARNGAFETHPLSSLVAIVIFGAVISAAAALLVERLAYRPLRGRGTYAPLITSIGMSFALQQSARGMFGSGVKSYPDAGWLSGTLTLGSMSLPKIELIVMGVAAAAMAGLYLLVNRTRIGTAMRATAEDPQAAALMGIDINRIVVFTFLIGGLMAGIAGVLYALIYKQVFFLMGFLPGVKAFGAAVLGGIGSIPGAMLGGIFLGVFESVAPTLILEGLSVPAAYQLRDLISFSLVILVLVLRPQGLFGAAPGRRA